MILMADFLQNGKGSCKQTPNSDASKQRYRYRRLLSKAAIFVVCAITPPYHTYHTPLALEKLGPGGVLLIVIIIL